jgi:hypothetical protein
MAADGKSFLAASIFALDVTDVHPDPWAKTRMDWCASLACRSRYQVIVLPSGRMLEWAKGLPTAVDPQAKNDSAITQRHGFM